MAKAKKKYEAVWSPSFDGWENMTGQEFHRLRQKAWSYYYNEMKPQELIANVYKWMRKKGYSRNDIHRAKTGATNVTMGTMATLLLDGCPSYYSKHAEYWYSLPGTSGDVRDLEEQLCELISKSMLAGEDLPVNPVDNSKPELSVQDHMREQLNALFDYIEGYLDEWMKGNSVANFKPYEAMQSYSVEIKPAHARMILNEYASLLQEARDLCDGNEELDEGYSGVSKKRRLEILAMLEKLENACNMYIETGKKTRKPRKKKAPSKEKLVAKLNYKENDSELSLVSINPLDILDAKELWVYNTKYRRLGKYVADELSGGLSVKGSTLQGFDSTKSVDKTIRKPEVVLKEFKSAGKVKLRKFLEEINSKEKPMNGRINRDVILLKSSR